MQAYLNNAKDFGKDYFSINMTLEIINQKGTVNTVQSAPFIAQTQNVMRSYVSDETAQDVIDRGRSMLFLNDARGSGYQFCRFNSAALRINQHRAHQSLLWWQRETDVFDRYH